MSSKTFKWVFLASLILLPSVSAATQKVAILPVEYNKFNDSGAAEECLDCVEKISKKTTAAVKDAELTPVPPEEVATLLKEEGMEPSLPCDDRECVSRIKDAVGADEAIFIRVQDRLASQEGFAVDVIFGSREGIAFENDSFYILLEELSKKISVALLKEPKASETAGADEEEAEGDPEDEGGPNPIDDKISPTAFWVSLTVTGALAVGSIFTGAAFHSKYASLENKDPWDRSQSDWDSARGLQITCRVLLGFTVVGAVTTTVLFFFTDFDEKDDESASLVLSPSLSRGGGTVSVGWRF